MRQSGFTLLELSIVLVIIGLIIGGVTVGSELIQQAALRSVSKDVYKYQTAIRTFQLKYRFPPGDLPNAYSYWPSSGSNTSICPGGLGVNGNGDGRIEARNWINTDEGSRAWQQLGLAGMIEGSYTGIYTSSGVIWGTNAPESRIAGAGFVLTSDLEQDGTCALTANSSAAGRNKIFFAKRGEVNGLTGDAGKMYGGGALSTADAKSIDLKFDDGMPLSGSVVGSNPSTLITCRNGTQDYYLDSTDPNSCRMGFYY